MSKKNYMIMDLLFLSVVSIVLEILGIFVQLKYIKEASHFWYISLNPIFILIAMFRWGWKGYLIFLPLTLATCLVYEGFSMISFFQYAIYLFGTSFIGINLLWFKFIPKKVMSKRLGYCILYSLTGYLLIAFGRSGASMIGGLSIITAINNFIFGEAFSIVMGIIIMMIVYYQKTILVDIDLYLLEVKESEN